MQRKLFVAVALASLSVSAFAAKSGTSASGAPSAPAESGNCDRSCLNSFVDRYLDAVVAHDPSSLPVTKTVKFTEDGQKLELGDAFWRTASARGTYKFYMDDPLAGEVGFFGTMREAGNPVSVALRLKIENRKIAEIETIVVREGMNPARPTDTGATSLEKIGAPDPLFSEVIPPAQRASRDNLAKTANMYFSGMQLNDGKGVYPFTDDCSRIENGILATGGRATMSSGSAARGNSTSYTTLAGCKAQFQSGLLHFVTRIRDRRFVVLDPEHGLALAFGFFDHAAGNTRTFKVPDGRTVTAGPTAPWTWEMAEVFRIENGKIRRIEAIFHRCPYGMGSGWSTWADSMSSQARW